MTTFESSRKITKRSARELYEILVDFEELGKLLPSDKLTNWYAEEDFCKFKVDGMGEVGLKIASKEQDKMIKYMGWGNVPFDFYLMILLDGETENGTLVQAIAEAKLNPLIKMVASPQINKFIESLVEAIARY